MTLNSIFKPDHSFLSSLNELCASSFSLQGLAFSLQDLKRSYLKASLLCARQLRYILCAKRSMGQSIRPFFPFYGQQLAISLHSKQQLNNYYIMFQHIDSFNKTNVRNSYFMNLQWILEQRRQSSITYTIRLYGDFMGDQILYPFTHFFSLDRLHALKINTLN